MTSQAAKNALGGVECAMLAMADSTMLVPGLIDTYVFKQIDARPVSFRALLATQS